MVTRAITSEIERPKRAKSSSGTKRKISPYNKFVKEELARLKESHPDLTHKERFKMAAENWKTNKP